jgi:phosphatidylglycerophosphate synthase
MARLGLVAGVLGQIVLLCCLDATVGLEPAGWIVGAGWGAAVALMMARGLGRAVALGPANRVTLLRAAVVGAAAALVVDGLLRASHPPVIGALAAAALLLDAADGWVARRTDSATALGARFDMEVDAFLILMLSLAVAASSGAWVLMIGLARYLLLLAGVAAPWLRVPVPASAWRKAVAATQGIVLTAVVCGMLAESVARSALVIAAAALAASFGEQIRWLWVHRTRSDTSGRSAPASRPVATRAT